MFDPIRALQSLEAGAKLALVIEHLFTFRATYRPSDLIALLDELDACITRESREIEIERSGLIKPCNQRSLNRD